MDWILELAREAEAADAVAPFDEATLLTLRDHPDQVTTWGDGRGVGLLIGSELGLLVAPDARGSGVGTQLLQDAPMPTGTVTAWSHGDHPAAAALAKTHDFRRARELWVMRRSTTDLPLAPDVPDAIQLRSFRPGDESELLRVNAAAFASHPEQGALDRSGLDTRMAEPWFDPEGLLMAFDGDQLLGFHWTKRHSATDGEVYVVGVDPAAQGRGVGKLVTLAGLHHLAGSSGDRPAVDAIHLYVEADNDPAVRLYAKLGFTRSRADTHVQYARE